VGRTSAFNQGEKSTSSPKGRADLVIEGLRTAKQGGVDVTESSSEGWAVKKRQDHSAKSHFGFIIERRKFWRKCGGERTGFKQGRNILEE